MISVRLAYPGDRDRAFEALPQLGCGTPEPLEAARELTLSAPQDGVAMIESAARALREAGIPVSDLGLRRPTLDDVFLTLTGAPAAGNGSGPDTAQFAAAEPEAAGARRSCWSGSPGRFPTATARPDPITASSSAPR